MEIKNAWEKYSDENYKTVMDFAEGYKKFISDAKTERECVKEVIEIAEKAGYKNLDSVSTLSSGDKVYVNDYGKAIVLYHIGKGEMEKGMNILGAHIDSPRLDIKMNPL